MPESAGATAILPFTVEIPGSTFATPIMRGSRPRMLSGFADSPISLAAFMLVHDARRPELISEVSIPVAVSVFPDELHEAVRAGFRRFTG
jgi:hypothetical protein